MALASPVRASRLPSPGKGSHGSWRWIQILAPIIDLLLLLLAGLLAHIWRFGDTQLPLEYKLSMAVVGLLYIGLGVQFRAFRIEHFARLLSAWRRAAQTITLTALVMMGVAFVSKQGAEFSRLWAISWYLWALPALLLVRVGWWGLARWSAGRVAFRLRLAIIGEAQHVLALYRYYLAKDDPALRVVGLYADRAVDPGPLPGVQTGSPLDVVELVRQQQVDQIILALPWGRPDLIREYLDDLRHLPVEVQLCPPVPMFEFHDRATVYSAGLPMLNLMTPPLNPGSVATKRLFDVVCTLLILLLAGPLMLMTAVLIRLESRGPILFRQPRYGIGNRVFNVYKFRSMYHGPRETRRVQQASRDDPRITRVGKWIRRLSIDELPQLFNVLKGDMSLVGPRPHAAQHNDTYAVLIDGYLERHRVRPGITGWAQVNGYRGETDTLEKMQKRVEYDLWYVDNWSLLLDVKILFLTAFRLLHSNAY